MERPFENDQELERTRKNFVEPLRQNSNWREFGRIQENSRESEGIKVETFERRITLTIQIFVFILPLIELRMETSLNDNARLHFNSRHLINYISDPFLQADHEIDIATSKESLQISLASSRF